MQLISGLMILFVYGVDFESKSIWLNGHKFNVEIADSPVKRSRGLMFRESLQPDQGMLFVFDKPEKLSFWMKNTRIPLGIAFFSEDLVLNQIIDPMEPHLDDLTRPKTYESSKPSVLALELKSGRFRELKIEKGAQLCFQKSCSTREKTRISR